MLQGAVEVLENTALWGLPTKVVRTESFGAMVSQNSLRAFDGLPKKSSTILRTLHSRQASLPTMPLTNNVLLVPISCCFLCLECPLSPLCVCMLSRFHLFETLWTSACQAPLSMGFYRQEYWNGLPCPLPGDPPNPGIKPESLISPVLAGRFFTTSSTSCLENPTDGRAW